MRLSDDIDFQPTTKKLRSFAIGSAVFYTILGLIFLAWVDAIPPWVSILLFVAAAVVLGFGIRRPDELRPVYIVLNVIALPIVWIVNTLLLGLAFYLVLTPVAIYRRRKRKDEDPLNLRFPGTEESYWVPSEERQSVKRYFKQF